MINLVVDKITIESDEQGFLKVEAHEENETRWLTIGDTNDYPLILESEKDIDDLANHLKMILKTRTNIYKTKKGKK